MPVKHLKALADQAFATEESVLAKLESASVANESVLPKIVFMFPGHGSLYVNIGLSLYVEQPVFRDAILQCSQLLKPHLSFDLQDVLYPMASQRAYAETLLQRPQHAAPALFSISYAMAKLLMSFGIQPDSMIGYNFGEFVAAHLAGAFSLADALKLVVTQAQLLQDLKLNSQLRVFMAAEVLQPLLDDLGLTIVSRETPSQCVVGGDDAALLALEATFQNKFPHTPACQRVQLYKSVDTEVLQPILHPYRKVLETVVFQQPHLDYVSNMTGDLGQQDLVSPQDYWLGHLQSPLALADGIQQLHNHHDCFFLGMGATAELARWVIPSHKETEHPHGVLSAVGLPEKESQEEYLSASNNVYQMMMRLWVCGVRVSWHEYYLQTETAKPFQLPSQLPQRVYTTHQVDPPVVAVDSEDEHVYRPSWRREGRLPHYLERTTFTHDYCWIIFSDSCGIGGNIAEYLRFFGQQVVLVTKRQEFQCFNEGRYGINPRLARDYNTLFDRVLKTAEYPLRIIHLWGVTYYRDVAESLDFPHLERNQYLGFYSLLFISQTLSRLEDVDAIAMLMVSNYLQQVLGDEKLMVDKASLLGACRSLSHEQSVLRLKSVDIDFLGHDIDDAPGFCVPILTEALSDHRSATEIMLAFRGKYCWSRTLEPITLPPQPSITPMVVDKGVYVILCGTEEFGFRFASILSQCVDARLVFVTPSQLPPPALWRQFVVENPDHLQSHSLRQLLALLSCGVEVIVKCADVANLRQMKKVFDEIEERYEKVNGVIHAVGSVRMEPYVVKTPESIDGIFREKIQSLFVLSDVVKTLSLDFILLCSSAYTELPSHGRLDYCGANACLDVACYSHLFSHVRQVVTANWDGWLEQLGTDSHSSTGAVLSDKDFQHIFSFLLNSGEKQLLIKPRS